MLLDTCYSIVDSDVIQTVIILRDREVDAADARFRKREMETFRYPLMSRILNWSYKSSKIHFSVVTISALSHLKWAVGPLLAVKTVRLLGNTLFAALVLTR